MSRYIDADAVITRIAEQMSYEIEAETGNETDCIDLAEELLNDLPSIDIVRCGECSKRMTDDCPMCNMCNAGKVPTDADDFCSYGERNDR